MASDQALAALVGGLQTQINAAVKDALAAAAAAAQPVEEAPVEEEVPSVITVKAIDKVNIRKSASTDADALGKAEIGDTFTQLEALENGWSKIDYNGTEAYVKSEFLETVDGAAPTGDEQPADEEGDTGTDTATTATTSGKVTVKETVNIRESASETGNKLGVAYRGEQYDLIEKSGEWCKITYKDQTAYVKADFVE